MISKFWFFCFLAIPIANFVTCQTLDELKQDGELLFIGKGSSKLYFTLLTTTGQDWNTGFSYCHYRGLRPASIQTEGDHLVITRFLDSTTELPSNSSFWVAATDHLSESRYQWLVDREEVRVGNWSSGTPSGNRSVNCLAINSNGEWVEDHCTGSRGRYYLCETPLEGGTTLLENEVKPFIPHPGKVDLKLVQESRNLTPIGNVGNKQYFLNDQFFIGFVQGLDICHEAGMQLASPEAQPELYFIRDYIRDNGLTPLLAVWDALSLSCLQSNSEYRWFYSGNAVNSTDPDLNGHGAWYQCVLLTLSSFRTYPCNGLSASVICELDNGRVS